MGNLEGIVGVIDGVKGRTSDIVYDLFFTEKRVIAAIVLHFSDLANIYLKHSQMSLLFGNALEQREVRMVSLKTMEERRLAFKEKAPDEILASHRANFEIAYEDVVSVAVRKGFLNTSLEFVVRSQPEGKVRFALEKGQIADVERLIRRVLPNTVR